MKYIKIFLTLILSLLSTVKSIDNNIVVYNDYDQDELLLLSKIVNGESHGETFSDKMRVGSIIINRVNSDLFPNTLQEVIYQKRQFDGINNRYFNSSFLDNPISVDGIKNKESMDAARLILLGKTTLPDSLYFYCNPLVATNKDFVRKTVGNVIIKGENHWYF